MIEVLKEALEALKDVGVLTDREWQAVHKNKANELRQAIAELESQEPVAWIWKDMRGQEIVSLFEPRLNSVPLYTHPPQRTEGRVCCQQYDICLEPCTSRGRHLAQRTEQEPQIAINAQVVGYVEPQRSESSGKPSAWVGLTNEEIEEIKLKAGSNVFSAIMFTNDRLEEKNT
jgi:hypothetical protein